jgi:hypothetical protein
MYLIDIFLNAKLNYSNFDTPIGVRGGVGGLVCP